MQTIMQELQPYLIAVGVAILTAIAGIIAAAGSALVKRFNRWADKQDEAVDRAALHSAAITGMAAAEVEMPEAPLADKVRATTRYMAQSSPGAIDRLKPDADVLEKIAVSKSLS